MAVLALSFLFVGALVHFATQGKQTTTDTAAESSRQLLGPTAGRFVGEPGAERLVGEPGVERLVGEPAEIDEVPEVLARIDDSQAGPTAITPVDGPEPAAKVKAEPASAAPKAVAPSTKPRTTSAPSKAPSTTAPRVKSATPTAKKSPTTTAKKSPTTTAAPTTTVQVAKTTAAPSTTVPVTNPGGSVGCTSNCKTVGFQNLDGKSNVTLENLIISNPDGRCISMVGARNVTVRNVTISNCGTAKSVSDGYDTGLINIVNASGITIEKSIIQNMSAERFGTNRNNAIQISSGTNISIRNNAVRDIHSDIGQKSGDYGNRAIKIDGNSSNITIDRNKFFNAGRNAVQISRVRGAANMSITNNVIEGRGRWDSDYEDMINLYSSSGTSSSPIRVAGNTMRNGGPSTTGTGMILGDGNASAGPSQFIVAENNTMINPGHVGINLAGGDNIKVRNNSIVGTGDVPHKTTTGMTINHYGYSSECRDHVVTGNRVWMDNQHLPGGTNHSWIPKTCTKNVRIDGNVFGDSSLK